MEIYIYIYIYIYIRFLIENTKIIYKINNKNHLQIVRGITMKNKKKTYNE